MWVLMQMNDIIINAKITVKKPYIYMAEQNTYINIKAHTNNLNKWKENKHIQKNDPAI